MPTPRFATSLARRALVAGISTCALAIAAVCLITIVADDQAAGGRLAACAGGVPWPRMALDREAHARRYAGRLGLLDGQGGVFTELLDREAWTAIDAEVAQAAAADRLRQRLRWQAPLLLAAVALGMALAAGLAGCGNSPRGMRRPRRGQMQGAESDALAPLARAFRNAADGSPRPSRPTWDFFCTLLGVRARRTPAWLATSAMLISVGIALGIWALRIDLGAGILAAWR